VNNAGEQHPDKEITDITGSSCAVQSKPTSSACSCAVGSAASQSGAVIVNCASVTMYQGSKELLGYSATKGAITAFTRSLSENLITHGIRVNAVAPGPIWTPVNPTAARARKSWSISASRHPWVGPASPMKLRPPSCSCLRGLKLHVRTSASSQWRDDRQWLISPGEPSQLRLNDTGFRHRRTRVIGRRKRQMRSMHLIDETFASTAASSGIR
jgi:NAD(P)-dependent dehydrogenase (short-subunit alcohol dehydrogenase family)